MNYSIECWRRWGEHDECFMLRQDHQTCPCGCGGSACQCDRMACSRVECVAVCTMVHSPGVGDRGQRSADIRPDAVAHHLRPTAPGANPPIPAPVQTRLVIRPQFVLVPFAAQPRLVTTSCSCALAKLPTGPSSRPTCRIPEPLIALRSNTSSSYFQAVFLVPSHVNLHTLYFLPSSHA